MRPNKPESQNESARAAERERFDETAQLAAERELEELINQRLGNTVKLYNLAILATVVLMLVAVTYWVFNINGRAPQPKTAAPLIPADFSNSLQVARQQLLDFQTAYADGTNRMALLTQTAYVNSTSRIALLKDVDAQMMNRVARLKEIDAEIASRVARLKELDSQLADVNITTNFQRFDVQLQNLENIRSNTEAIFENVSELNDYFIALYSLRPDASNRITRASLAPLRRIAQNKDHSLSSNARAALRTLADGLESERQIYLMVGPTMPFNTNTITFDQTIAILKRQTDPYRIIKLLTFIASNTNFSKGQQMNFMMDTYEHSTNLVEVYVAELAIKSEARLPELDPFSFDQVQDWWRTHQSSYR